jgi:hypothetical protein
VRYSKSREVPSADVELKLGTSFPGKTKQVRNFLSQPEKAILDVQFKLRTSYIFNGRYLKHSCLPSALCLALCNVHQRLREPPMVSEIPTQSEPAPRNQHHDQISSARLLC